MSDPSQLEEFLDAATEGRAEPSEALYARIAEDARQVDLARRPPRRAYWPAGAGLMAAGLAGIWIGYAQPFGFDPDGILGGVDADGLVLELSYGDLMAGVE